MAEMIAEPIRVLLIATGVLLAKKYVFMEPDLKKLYQRVFNAAAIVLPFAVNYFFGYTAAYFTLSGIVAVNVLLARKRLRILGFFIAWVPLGGIIEALFIPLFDVIPYLIGVYEESGDVDAGTKDGYLYTMFFVMFALLAVFLFAGRSWRRWFDENMRGRRPSRAELWLLSVAGIIMISFNNDVSEMIATGLTNPNNDETGSAEYILAFMTQASIGFALIVITLIVIVLQGQKRSLYHDQLAGMQAGMITFMADVVENRDDNTGGHIRRTAKYVECIAKELKKQSAYKKTLTEEYMRDIIVAAPLHDIGKIHIPDSVLNKPGRLTDEEFKVMKTHTTAGKELLIHAKEELGESGYLIMALEMATYHHEWWNGKGYPYGISGEEIPLCARIMAVADVFDALVSKRCYKSAMPLEKAYSIIREESGTHFDPEVVNAFFSTKEQIEKELELYEQEQSAAEQIPTEQALTEQKQTEQNKTEQKEPIPAEQTAKEQVLTEQVLPKEVTEEQSAAEEVPAEQATTESAPTEQES